MHCALCSKGHRYVFSKVWMIRFRKLCTLNWIIASYICISKTPKTPGVENFPRGYPETRGKYFSGVLQSLVPTLRKNPSICLSHVLGGLLRPRKSQLFVLNHFMFNNLSTTSNFWTYSKYKLTFWFLSLFSEVFGW